MMTSQLFKSGQEEGRLSLFLDRRFERLSRSHRADREVLELTTGREYREPIPSHQLPATVIRDTNR
jgi:hypothetical protein